MRKRSRARSPSGPSAPTNADERATVLEALHSDEFVDRAPAEVVHTLLAQGKYLASERTMYRILADSDEVRERRKQRKHVVYACRRQRRYESF